MAPTYEHARAKSMRRKSGVPIGPSAPAPERQPHHTFPDRRRPYPARGTNVLVGAYLPLIPVRRITGLRYPRPVPRGLQLCYDDAYAQRTAARVVAVQDAEPAFVALDRTVFYPGGGGQPADRGTMRRLADGAAWAVTSARKLEGEILHELEPGLSPPAVGDDVEIEVDWYRRYLLMRTHTSLHVLCGVVWRDWGAQVTGGNMEPGSGRMDFEFERMSAELVDEIERRVNAEVEAARDVRVANLPREEAFAIPDLIRTKVNLLPPGIEEVRTVEIVGLDLQADGGTHVANTREVGPIRVSGYESKGRSNKRIRIELDAA
jgi:misacylated tRNA(Ala) deacylase